MTTLKTLEAYRGDTNTFTISHSYTAAQISKVRFYVRKDVDSDLLIKLASDTHASQFTIADSSVTVTLLPADTKPIKAGSYVYDCELTLTSGTVVTVQAGKFWLEGDVAYDAATDTPPTLEYHVSQNVYDALNAASSPSSSNAFVTQSVLDALGIGDLSDVVIGATPANPSYLRWDGTDWSDAGVAQIVSDLNAATGLNADTIDNMHLSDLDARYVDVAGDTMTGGLVIQPLTDGPVFDVRDASGLSLLQIDSSITTNVAVGYRAGESWTADRKSVAVGAYALQNSNADSNVAIGFQALLNATGTSNVVIGKKALSTKTSISTSVGIGDSAAYNAATSDAVIIGKNAAMLASDGITSVSSITDSVIIGADTKPLNSTSTNEIIIGTGAIGHGDNTVTIGNSSITDTWLFGTLHIGADIVLPEITTPAAPPADSVRIIARDDGTGLTELCAQFNTGDVLVLGVQGLTVPTYTTANVTATRSLDVSTATLTDVANVLGTLIQDLQARRILK